MLWTLWFDSLRPHRKSARTGVARAMGEIGWDASPGRRISFPDTWPDSLRSAYRRLMDECAQVRVVTVAGRVFRRCYLTSSGDGTPAVARRIYDGYADGVDLIEMPEAIEPLRRGGAEAPHWSLFRDEPVMWVMTR